MYKLIDAPITEKKSNKNGYIDKRIKKIIVDENNNRVQVTKDNLEELLQLFRPEIEAIGEFDKQYKPMKFHCNKHDRDFETCPQELFYYNVGCNDCKKEKRWADKVIKKSEFIRLLNENCPEIEIERFEDDDTSIPLLSSNVFLKNIDGRKRKIKIETALKDFKSIFKPTKRIRERNKIYDNEGNVVTKLNKELFYELVKVQRTDIKLLSEYIDAKTDIRCLCLIHNKEFDTTPYRILADKVGCEDCLKLKKQEINCRTHEEYIQQFNERWPNIEVIKIHDNFLNNRTKVTLRCKIHSDHEWTIASKQAMWGNGCKICNEEEEARQGNNVYNTFPELIKYFENPEDAKKYTPYSGKKVELVCPDCGTRKTMYISNLVKVGFGCPVCSDGVSYPNKFGRNLMKIFEDEIDVLEFEKYIKYEDSKNLFDIYFEKDNKKYVIELDGGFHFQDIVFHKKNKQKEKDKIKDKIAKENGWIMIRIPCPNSTKEELIEGFQNSLINNLFDLSRVNWNKIDATAQKSLVKQVCDFYKEHQNKTYKEIGDEFGIGASTATKYIRKGKEIGWLEDKPKKNIIKRSVAIACYDLKGNKLGEFNSYAECGRFIQENYDPDFKTNIISQFFYRGVNNSNFRFEKI